jgi:hypothetical protein
MIQWKRPNVFLLLCLFGDGKDHSWLEVVNLGTRLFVDVDINIKKHATHQAKFEEFLKKAINYGLIEMVETKEIRLIRQQRFYQISKEDYLYKISTKGDKLLRQEQAEREGNAFYYNLFDRSVGGKFGVDAFAPLTPTDYGVREKHSYKVKDFRK